MKKIIAANWKCNPPRIARARELLRSFRFLSQNVQVIFCLPFPYIYLGSPRGAVLGAQDVFWKTAGPFTGEVSSEILKSMGVRYVIVGHSERRWWFKETDEMVAQKVRAALTAGLRVILCVGEPWVVRRNGVAAAKRFVLTQLRRDLRGIRAVLLRRLIVTYEPIWAISTNAGKPDTPEEAVAMVRAIRQRLRVSYRVPHPVILYGGSVTSQNILGFIHYTDVDGVLVGGASLDPKEFKKIVAIASQVS